MDWRQRITPRRTARCERAPEGATAPRSGDARAGSAEPDSTRSSLQWPIVVPAARGRQLFPSLPSTGSGRRAGHERSPRQAGSTAGVAASRNDHSATAARSLVRRQLGRLSGMLEERMAARRSLQSDQSRRVGLVKEPVAGGGHVQQELGVSAHRGEVQLHQVVHRTHRTVLRRMVEPAGPDRHVDLGGTPHRSQRRSVLERVTHRVVALAGESHDRRIHRRPVRIAGDSALIPAPADVRSGVGEDHRAGLEPADEPPHPRPVVDLTTAVRPFPVGAVEPDLGDRAVAGSGAR